MLLRLKRRGVALSLSMLVAACTPIHAQGGEGESALIYTYVSHSYFEAGPAKIVIDFSSGELIYPHTYGDLENCESDQWSACFSSDSLDFCLPAGRTQFDEWGCNGARYRVTSREVLEILGEAVEVYVIESAERVFYYSPTQGLLAIKFRSEGPLAEFFISTKEFGYGHAD